MFPGASTADESNPGADADYVVVGAPSTCRRRSSRAPVSAPVNSGRTPRPSRTTTTGRARTSPPSRSLTTATCARGTTPAYLEYLNGVVTDISWNDATPLLVGGEHTVTVAAVRALNPDVFVALDAHLDLRAALDGDPLSHSTVTRHALDVADEAIVGRTRRLRGGVGARRRL